MAQCIILVAGQQHMQIFFDKCKTWQTPHGAVNTMHFIATEKFWKVYLIHMDIMYVDDMKVNSMVH